MVQVIHGLMKVEPGQLNLEKLFSIERFLRSRGFQLESEGNEQDTLVVNRKIRAAEVRRSNYRNSIPGWSHYEVNLIFNVFNDVSLRSKLLKVITDDSFLASFQDDIVFGLTDQALNKIKAQGISPDIWTKLQDLKDKKYKTQIDFEHALESLIGKDRNFDLYKEQVLESIMDDLPALILHPNFKRDRDKFSRTFQWYVGALLIKHFMAFSSSFDVKVKNIVRNTDNGTSGDYDVLSILGDMSLLHLECKTGKCKQNSIKNAFERSLALHSIATIFFLEKGTNRNSLKQQLKDLRHPKFGKLGKLLRIQIKNLSESEVYKWFDCYFVPANEETGKVEEKLRTVMRVIAANRSALFESYQLSIEEYNTVGYECSEIL